MTQQNFPTSIVTERKKYSFGFWFLGLAGLICFTQIIRLLVLNFDSALFQNEKFAFSVDIPTPIIYTIYVLVFIAIIRYLTQHWSNLVFTSRFGFGLILAGGLANLGERIYFGYVVDYIFIFHGILNLADFFILLGIVLIFISRTNSEKV